MLLYSHVVLIVQTSISRSSNIFIIDSGKMSLNPFKQKRKICMMKEEEKWTKGGEEERGVQRKWRKEKRWKVVWLTHFLDGFHLLTDPVLKPPPHHQSTQRQHASRNVQERVVYIVYKNPFPKAKFALMRWYPSYTHLHQVHTHCPILYRHRHNNDKLVYTWWPHIPYRYNTHCYYWNPILNYKYTLDKWSLYKCIVEVGYMYCVVLCIAAYMYKCT